jgi:hypothetical protein
LSHIRHVLRPVQASMRTLTVRAGGAWRGRRPQMMRMTHRCDVDSLKLSRYRAGELVFCCQHCGCAHHGYSDCTLPLVAPAAKEQSHHLHASRMLAVTLDQRGCVCVRMSDAPSWLATCSTSGCAAALLTAPAKTARNQAAHWTIIPGGASCRRGSLQQWPAVITIPQVT